MNLLAVELWRSSLWGAEGRWLNIFLHSRWQQKDCHSSHLAVKTDRTGFFFPTHKWIVMCVIICSCFLVPSIIFTTAWFKSSFDTQNQAKIGLNWTNRYTKEFFRDNKSTFHSIFAVFGAKRPIVFLSFSKNFCWKIRHCRIWPVWTQAHYFLLIYTLGWCELMVPELQLALSDWCLNPSIGHDKDRFSGSSCPFKKKI